MPDHGGQGESESQDEGVLNGMSPAELEAMQRKNCVFCHIASGKVPARKVYEDSECVAVLDINPASPGHALLMPKEHYAIMLQVPEPLISHLFIIAKGLSQAGLKAFQSKGTTVFAANGTSAGQRAPHFMLHVIPRLQGDSIGVYIPSRALPEKESEKIAAALAAALGGRKTSATAGQGGGRSAEKREATEKGEGKKEETPKEIREKNTAAEETGLDAITDFLTKGEGGAK